MCTILTIQYWHFIYLYLWKAFPTRAFKFILPVVQDTQKTSVNYKWTFIFLASSRHSAEWKKKREGPGASSAHLPVPCLFPIFFFAIFSTAATPTERLKEATWQLLGQSSVRVCQKRVLLFIKHQSKIRSLAEYHQQSSRCLEMCSNTVVSVWYILIKS